MKNFDDIIAPLLERKYRILTINLRAPPKERKPRRGITKPGNKGSSKAVVTPLGRFSTCNAAAQAHGLTYGQLTRRIQTNQDFYYDTKFSPSK